MLRTKNKILGPKIKTKTEKVEKGSKHNMTLLTSVLVSSLNIEMKCLKRLNLEVSVS